MKKITMLFTIVTLLLFSDTMFALASKTEQVTVRSDKTNSFKAKKDLEKKAFKSAILQYITRSNPSISPDCLAKAKSISRKTIFVKTSLRENLERNDDQWEATFTIRLNTDLINRELEEIGCSIQSQNTKFIIMEDPPSIAQMKFISDTAGSSGKLRGLGPFVAHYTDFQRGIRDRIIKGANSHGLNLEALENNPQFSKLKYNREDPLLGVYYDAKKEKFSVNDELLRSIKNSYASFTPLIFSYRIDSLYFDQKERFVKATVSIALSNIKNNSRKVIGTESYTYTIPKGKRPSSQSIRDLLISASSMAASSLIKPAKDEARRLSTISINQKNNLKHACTNIAVNLNSKRKIYSLKKVIKSQSKGVQSIEIEGSSLVLKLDSSVDKDDFLYGYLLDEIESLGIKIDENKIFNQGKTIVINQ